MISVIGGSGFIGSVFCEILKKYKISFNILDITINNTFKNKISDFAEDLVLLDEYYKNKYLKYKAKYLEAKKKLEGGEKSIIYT